jgi:Fe2+ transport system protein FeoA
VLCLYPRQRGPCPRLVLIDPPLRKTLTPLSSLRPGESAVIEKLDGSPEVMLHLVELGLVPGEKITLLRTAPWGDPLEIELMSYRLAIRRSEAQKIMVSREGPAR